MTGLKAACGSGVQTLRAFRPSGSFVHHKAVLACRESPRSLSSCSCREPLLVCPILSTHLPISLPRKVPAGCPVWGPRESTHLPALEGLMTELGATEMPVRCTSWGWLCPGEWARRGQGTAVDFAFLKF